MEQTQVTPEQQAALDARAALLASNEAQLMNGKAEMPLGRESILEDTSQPTVILAFVHMNKDGKAVRLLNSEGRYIQLPWKDKEQETSLYALLQTEFVKPGFTKAQLEVSVVTRAVKESISLADLRRAFKETGETSSIMEETIKALENGADRPHGRMATSIDWLSIKY